MKISELFYFNRSDRRAVVVFLVLGLVALTAVLWLGDGSTEPVAAGGDSLTSAPVGRTHAAASTEGGYYAQETTRAERFVFDPNTADSTALLRLGLQPWQVRNIYKYRAAGGVYHRREDFARVYGLTQKQYRELEPYIRISSDYAPAADLYAAPRSRSYGGGAHYESERTTATPDTTRRYTPKLKPTEHIDLNLSDTSALQRVPGIGSFYARRIVQYRERLGGYYSAEQLREIEDFPVSAISFFVLSNNTRRINVNKLKLNELKRHPYINYYQARAITDYRRLRGPLQGLEQLRLLPEFTDRDLERLSHYVEF